MSDAIEHLAAALHEANERIRRDGERIRHLETTLGERDAKLRGLTDRGALLVMLQGQADAKIAEVNASADFKRHAVDALGPNVKPVLDVIMREIGLTKAPALQGAATEALRRILEDKDVTRLLQITAGDEAWAALLEVFSAMVSVGLPDTAALRYQEARKTRPDMLPLQEFCEQAVDAELARRGIKTPKAAKGTRSPE